MEELSQWARRLLEGSLTATEFLARLAGSLDRPFPPPATHPGSVTLDLDRKRRCGYPEVIFAEGKSLEALEHSVSGLLEAAQPVLVTRLADTQAERLRQRFSTGIYNPVARTFRCYPHEYQPGPARGRVTIVTAGTTDLPVAEEARETLLWMNVDITLVQDVGVAGPHRLQERLDAIRRADAIVVVAGMEGALPSVVGGYASCPVFAVPTSVGYGANFGGVAALLTMLNSCAANVAVVNINAGFKAGYLAGLVAQRVAIRSP